MTPFDVIVAPITGFPAAVAWLRLSGHGAWEIGRDVFGPWPEVIETGRTWFGRWSHGDEGLAIPFAAGRGYTGEESIEISLHGSRASVRGAIDACCAAGARMAEPGEFTQRAFLNGRLDLTQAEAVRETVDALTAQQLRHANLGRAGRLRETISRLREIVLGLLASVEASVDFSEEIGDFDRSEAEATTSSLLRDIDRLLGTASDGRIIREGLRIAIVGPPNAGKSSLLNALLKEERAIVTDIPGTTRDYLEERADFDGFPVILIDTAGIRDAVDPVEAIGVQRSRAQAAAADLVWYVHDASTPFPDEAEIFQFGKSVLLIANKSDQAVSRAGIAVSARTGDGLEELVRTSLADLGARLSEPTIGPRAEAHLAEAREALNDFMVALSSHAPDDLLSVHLSTATEALGKITGETASPDIVDRVFHNFCVGK